MVRFSPRFIPTPMVAWVGSLSSISKLSFSMHQVLEPFRTVEVILLRVAENIVSGCGVISSMVMEPPEARNKLAQELGKLLMSEQSVLLFWYTSISPLVLYIESHALDRGNGPIDAGIMRSCGSQRGGLLPRQLLPVYRSPRHAPVAPDGSSYMYLGNNCSEDALNRLSRP